MTIAILRFGAVSLALLLAACATLAPRLEPPQVRGAQLRVVVLSYPLLRVGVDLAVHNPNPADVALAALDVDLDVEGQPAGSASLAQPVTLRAREQSIVHLDMSAHLGAALAGVARSLDRGGAPLRYELRGIARLAGGETYPFVHRAELAWR